MQEAPQYIDFTYQGMGIAEKVGDTSAFWILTEDTKQLIARRIIRTTKDPKTVNQRLDQLQPTIQEPNKTIVGMNGLLPNINHPPLALNHLLDMNSQLNMQATFRRLK